MDIVSQTQHSLQRLSNMLYLLNRDAIQRQRLAHTVTSGCKYTLASLKMCESNMMCL